MQRLLDKLMFTYNYIEMARVTGVPISFLLARGQSIKARCCGFAAGPARRFLLFQSLRDLLALRWACCCIRPQPPIFDFVVARRREDDIIISFLRTAWTVLCLHPTDH